MLVHNIAPPIVANVMSLAVPEVKSTQDTQPSNNKSNSNTNPKPEDKTTCANKTHKRRWLKVLKWAGYITGYGVLSTISILKTPGMHVTVNDYLQNKGLVPTPTNIRSIENEHNFDNFFMNFPGFEEIRDNALSITDPQSLDTNKSGIVLDSQDEVQLLRQRLLANLQASKQVERQNQITSAVVKLDEMNTANLLIWGSNPDPSYLFQQGRPNCQLMGAIQAHYLTPKNLQILKSLIEVTSFDHITGKVDTVVHLKNRRSIPVPFNDLVRWMSPIGLNPSYSADGTPEKPITLAIPILTYALEKELSDNYDSVPPAIPSSAPILLTGKNYTTVCISPYLLNTFNDSELANIFSMAPERTIMLASWGELSDLNEWLNSLRNNKFQFLPQSDEKAQAFRQAVEGRSQLAINNNQPTADTINNQLASSDTQTQVNLLTSPAATSTGTSQVESQISRSSTRININNILKHHVYVVRGYNPQDQTVTIMDSHGTNSSIKLSEIRSMWNIEGMAAVIMPRNDVPKFSQESLMSYLLLLLIATGHFTLHKRNKPRN